MSPKLFTANPAGRLVSLDVFRGITIAAMVLVNNPGTWSSIYWPLEHAEWNGWTPTDLVFPFFLFIVGVSITLAFARRVEEGSVKRDLYFKVIKRSAIIFGLGLFLNGFPFFQWSGAQEGAVFYDGNWYEQVPMQYDLQEDNLVINDYTGNNSIRLIKNKVRYFIIAGHRFVLLAEGEGLPAPGFYEQLYSGPVNAWVRRQKVTTQVLNAAGNDLRYTQYNSWFIEKQSVFYAVENEHAVLAVLADKKEALKKYIRSAGLRFKKDPEGFLAKVIDYYTQPNH